MQQEYATFSFKFPLICGARLLDQFLEELSDGFLDELLDRIFDGYSDIMTACLPALSNMNIAFRFRPMVW